MSDASREVPRMPWALGWNFVLLLAEEPTPPLHLEFPNQQCNWSFCRTCRTCPWFDLCKVIQCPESVVDFHLPIGSLVGLGINEAMLKPKQDCHCCYNQTTETLRREMTLRRLQDYDSFDQARALLLQIQKSWPKACPNKSTSSTRQIIQSIDSSKVSEEVANLWRDFHRHLTKHLGTSTSMSSRALPLACLPETHHVFWDLFIPLWRASFNKIKWRPMMHCNHHHWGSYHGLCHLTASGHQLGKFDLPPPFSF